jgi:hypothetical protein
VEGTIAPGGRTLRDIRDAQRKYAQEVEKRDPDLAKRVREWADHLDDVIGGGKELLG